MFAVYTELLKDEPKPRFTIGIVDDVTNLSLPEVKPALLTLQLQERLNVNSGVLVETVL